MLQYIELGCAGFSFWALVVGSIIFYNSMARYVSEWEPNEQGIFLDEREDISEIDQESFQDDMNEYENDDGTMQKKREWRSKDEADERNYVCGCGKSYLSYAALYTHAKTKHNGIFPEGTNNL